MLLAALLLLPTTPARAGGGKDRHADADSIMGLTFSYPKRNHLHIGLVRSRVYSKIHIDTDIRNKLFRLLPNSVHIDKGKNHYFGEGLAKLEYSDLGIMNHKNIAFYSSLRRLKKMRDIYSTNVTVQVYTPYLISNKLLSPFNHANRRHYHYHADSVVIATDGTPRTWITFTPKSNNTYLVSGRALIDSETGRIDSATFKAVYDNLLYFTVGFKIASTTGEMSLLPKWVKVDAHYNVAKNKANMSSLSVFDHYEISSHHYADSLRHARGFKKYNISRLELRSPDTARVVRDPEYFSSVRPIPLNHEEDSIYQTLLSRQTATKPAAETKSNALRISSMEDLFLDKHSVNLLGGRATLRIPAMFSLSMLQWSGNRGFAIQNRLKFSLKAGSVTANLNPKLGYSFKQKQFYWEVPLNVKFLPGIGGGLESSVGNGNRIYSSLQAKEVRERMKEITNYDSLLNVFNRYNFNYYNDMYIRNMFYFSPLCGTKVKLGAVYHKREQRNRNREAAASGMRHYYKSFAPRVDIECTPGTYYYESSSKEKIALQSYMPTIRGSYERGVNMFGCKNRYERMEFDCSYKIGINTVSSLSLRGGCGFFTNRKEMYFVDYDNFSFHDMPAGWDDDMSNEFHLLDRRFYNESNYYVLAGAAYDTPMLLFGNLPLISRAINRERLYFNAVSLHALNPYIEAGYGVATNFFDGALFVGAGNATGFEFGAKIALRLFENW